VDTAAKSYVPSQILPLRVEHIRTGKLHLIMVGRAPHHEDTRFFWQGDSTKGDCLSCDTGGDEPGPVEAQCLFHNVVNELRVLADRLPMKTIIQYMKQASAQQTVGSFIAGKDQIHNLRQEFLLGKTRLAAAGGYDQITGEIVLRGSASLLDESLNIARIG